MTNSTLRPKQSVPDVPTPPRDQGSIAKRFKPWRERLDSIKHELGQPLIISVLGVVLGFTVIVRIEAVQKAIPLIQISRLWFHRGLCAMSPRLLTAKWVRMVEIDQQLHADLGEPTNRTFLAKLVSQAVRGDAAVIVLDIKLVAPEGKNAGQDLQELAGGDLALIQAARDASRYGVPVVLTTWLKPGSNGIFRRLPNFFLDRDLPLPGKDGQCSLPDPEANPAMIGPRLNRLPACVRIGNINTPVDLRQAPLVTLTDDPDGPSSSVALATVSAYEDAIQREPRTENKPLIRTSIEDDEFVFASFIPESGFQKIPVRELARGTKTALEKCRGRILIVGGKWRADAGHGAAVDTYDTPVGEMAGMYLHANYIEALLDDRYQREVPLLIALAFDLFAGAWLYIQFHRAKTRLARAGVVVIPAFLLLASYVIFTNLNFYLDFVLPLGACFAHLGVEYIRDYGRMRRAELVERAV